MMKRSAFFFSAGSVVSMQDPLEEARYLLALKLYELGKISSGKAAKIAGTNRVVFLSLRK
jgi:predicted HTH domain antitoxin